MHFWCAIISDLISLNLNRITFYTNIVVFASMFRYQDGGFRGEGDRVSDARMLDIYIVVFAAMFRMLRYISLYFQQCFGIKTAGLEEKATACQMLGCYACELKEGFAPYAEQVVKIMVPLLKFYFHDGILYVMYCDWLLLMYPWL
jgi:hypothetical protein